MIPGVAVAGDVPAVVAPLEVERKAFAVRQSLVGLLIVLTCMPGGFVLDVLTYPAWALTFFLGFRLGCSVLVLPLIAVLRGPRAEQNVRWIGLAWPMLPAVAIGAMIALTEGGGSPYYAGLMLVLIVACLLMPYELREALAVCGAVLLVYVASCVAHAIWQPGSPFPLAEFGANAFFLGLTSLICVSASASHYRRRREEHALRQRVAGANAELVATNERLAELDRMKNEFFANVSHEFRTPLTLILAPAGDLVSRPDLGAEDRASLRLIHDNALRLLRLINDLLDVIRLDTAKLRLKPEPVDVPRFLAGVSDAVRHQAEEKGLALHTDVVDEGGEPIVAQLDAGRFERVVLNLLSNAIKFTPPGGAIRVSSRRDGDAVSFSISDTGVGIPPADLPHVFDRFHQADASSTREHQGLGIGLALTRELVEAHKGEINASSELGRGTTMTVSLPRVIDSGHGSPTTTTAPRVASSDDPLYSLPARKDEPVPEVPAEASSGTSTRPLVLVADDEPDMRQFVVDLLRKEFDVIEAVDGVEALNAIAAREPAAVLLDLMMPKMDGLEVLSRACERANVRRPKVVMLTARDDPSIKLDALRLGADDFLAKPFSSAEVLARVRNLIEQRKLEDDLAARNAELRDTLDSLQRAKVDLIQSEKMNALGKMAAGLLHEINNPLNYMNMATQLGLSLVGPEGKPAVVDAARAATLRETLTDLDDGVRQIQAVTTDLHAFAYPSQQNRPEQFALREAVVVARRMSATFLDGCRVEERGLNAQVLMPRSHAVQLLMNLLNNAADATDGQADRLIIVAAELVEGDRVQLRVMDSGPGINEQEQRRVLEPFYTTKDVGQGTGLGLSICHTIVTGLGGQLMFERIDGRFTVCCDLPAIAPSLKAGWEEGAMMHRTVKSSGMLMGEMEEERCCSQ